MEKLLFRNERMKIEFYYTILYYSKVITGINELPSKKLSSVKFLIKLSLE